MSTDVGLKKAIHESGEHTNEAICSTSSLANSFASIASEVNETARNPSSLSFRAKFSSAAQGPLGLVMTTVGVMYLSSSR
jgi:hypothetical protein